MHWLPPPIAGEFAWRLPLADFTASAWAEALLAEPVEGRRKLAAVLPHDPALCAWAVAAVGRGQLTTVAEIAAWLLANGGCALLNGGCAPPPLEEGARRRFAECAADAVRLACLAASLSVRESPAAFDRVWLAGLLHAVRDWPDSAAGSPFPSFEPSEPHVIQAAELLAAPSRPSVSQQGQRRDAELSAEQARQQWLRRDEGAAELLLALLNRLSRLSTLETEFAATLEREKLASLAEFAAGAGHEINNPLAVISGRAQLLLRDEADPERRRELALIHRQAMRVHEMIADLRLFARPPVPRKETCDVVEVAQRVVAEATEHATERRARLRLSKPPEPISLDADPIQLAVALRALIDNSLFAAPLGGEVVVAVGEGSPSGGERFVAAAPPVWLRVSDNGPGLAAEIRRHAFDPFYSGRQAGRGLGMGLSKCWRIVTNHGGQVVIDSTAAGTTVTIVLPRS